MKKILYRLIGLSFVVFYLLFMSYDVIENAYTNYIKQIKTTQNNKEKEEKEENENLNNKVEYQETDEKEIYSLNYNPYLITKNAYINISEIDTITEKDISINTIKPKFSEEVSLIIEPSEIDYKSYVPYEIINKKCTDKLKKTNPEISITAEAGLLIDAKTKEVLYYKEPLKVIFPASTAKLLTAMVAVDYGNLEDIIKIGDEIKLIASDSSKANLVMGHELKLETLLEALLLPSGNDAAYAIANYIGRKVSEKDNVTTDEALSEFMELVNGKLREIGAVNSCFKTPDGYDAIGQYTNAYDMGLIGIEALAYEKILEICQKPKSRVICESGQTYVWNNTNGLINKDSGNYNEYAIGLKTGTSTMAGRCLVSAIKVNGKEYVAVVMGAGPSARFTDTKKILGLVIN